MPWRHPAALEDIEISGAFGFTGCVEWGEFEVAHDAVGGELQIQTKVDAASDGFVVAGGNGGGTFGSLNAADGGGGQRGGEKEREQAVHRVSLSWRGKYVVEEARRDGAPTGRRVDEPRSSAPAVSILFNCQRTLGQKPVPEQ